MPDYESISGVYAKLGWKVLVNGRVVPPDPERHTKRRRKSREARVLNAGIRAMDRKAMTEIRELEMFFILGHLGKMLEMFFSLIPFCILPFSP